MQFQTIYKGVVYNDGYDNIDDAIEDIKHSCARGLDENNFSIEVLLERDYKRMKGYPDTRLTVEQLCQEFQNEKYDKSVRKEIELKELAQKMLSCLNR